MEKIQVTRNISENLDLRLLAEIVQILENKIQKKDKENLDKFQIFEVSENKLICRQEVPEEIEEYTLKNRFQKIKIWAVQGTDKIMGRYWTIMFPEDY